MTGKKDPFWKHTKKIGDNEFSCNFCQRHFRGRVSVARFKSHLAGETRRDTKVCDKVPKDVQSAALHAIHASKLKKNKSPVSPNNVEECAIISHPSSSMVKGAHQSTTMPRKIYKEEDKCLVDRKLAKFILSIGVPSNVIQSPSFIDFAKSLAEFGPGYKVPSPLRFTINSIGYCKKDVAKYIAEVMRPLAETGCTLILDQWVDCNCTLSVNIFVYTPKGVVFSFKHSSSKKIEDCVLDIVNNLGSRHVIQYFKGKGFYRLNYPQISPTCASLEIEHLLLYLFDLEWIYKTLGFARSLFVKYLKKHDTVYYQISKGYESDDLNDSASSFLMLQAVLKDENELKALHLPVASDTDGHFSSIIRCSEFWRDGKELVQVLQPIFQVLNLVNGYMSTSGYLYEAFHRAKAKIDKCLNQNQDRYKLILEKFESCQMSTILPIHMAAALLNPDYKFSEDLKDYDIEDGINYILEKLVASEEKEAFRIQLDSYRTVLRPLFRSKVIKIDVHPRIWWERYGDTFPVLRKYAIHILSQPCSMLSCHRYRLKHICSINDYKLRVNTMLMEKYSMLEAGDEEPIDFDKLSGSPDYDDNQDLDIDEEPIDFDKLNGSSEFADDPDDQDLDIDDSKLNDTEVDPLIIRDEPVKFCSWEENF